VVPKPKPSRDRDQTDDSLREEREESDRAFVERQAAVQDDADQIVQQARENADAVLTAARDKADHRLAIATGGVPAPSVIEGREIEDDALRDERGTADASLQREREETARSLARLLPVERDKTDLFLLTERARSDREIAQRDDFLGMVSHDLRNLLGGIVTSAAILSERTDDSEDGALVRSGADRIQRYAARMNRLIGDLVDVASIDAGVLAMTPVRGDGRKLVAEAVETFRAAAAAKRIGFEVEVTAEELLGEFDHDRLLQVFANLLSNAIKFSAQDKTITVRGARGENALHFSVTDRGVGIPAEMLELIFERFWQAGKNDRLGMGLGLYISRCIVEAHAGRIWAESSVGTGTTLHFTIPLQGHSPSRPETLPLLPA
jgi:signal transduction histidine kinase